MAIAADEVLAVPLVLPEPTGFFLTTTPFNRLLTSFFGGLTGTLGRDGSAVVVCDGRDELGSEAARETAFLAASFLFLRSSFQLWIMNGRVLSVKKG